MDHEAHQMWSNPEQDMDPAVFIQCLYDIGQKKNDYKTKVEFHYKKLLESCATGDKTGAKQSHYRVQVFGNDYFTWYFLYIDKLDSCGHIEQLDVPALRLDARSEAVYLRLMIDHGERYYDEYFNESMDITWELGSYAEPNLSDDSMHTWWYINFANRVEKGEYLLDDMGDLTNFPDATCDGLSDCKSESGSVYEFMDSPFENGCDTAVTALKAGSLVIIDYLQTKITTLQNKLSAFGISHSKMEDPHLLQRVCELDALETLGELQATSRIIIDNLQDHIAALEREVRALKCGGSTLRSPTSDTHLTSVSDTHPTAELEYDGRFHSLPEIEEINSQGWHAGCLVIIQHLQAKVACLQHELSASKCDQAVEKNSGFDSQSCAGDSLVCGRSPWSEVMTPEPSGGEIAIFEPHRGGSEYMGQSPTLGPGTSSGDHNGLCDAYEPSSGKISIPNKLENKSLPESLCDGFMDPSRDCKIDGACEVKVQLPAPSGSVGSDNRPSSGESVLWNKNKWFPDEQGGSSVKLKWPQAFASSNPLCLL